MTSKNIFFIALVLFCSCGGKISDEQRKAIVDEGKIKGAALSPVLEQVLAELKAELSK